MMKIDEVYLSLAIATVIGVAGIVAVLVIDNETMPEETMKLPQDNSPTYPNYTWNKGDWGSNITLSSGYYLTDKRTIKEKYGLSYDCVGSFGNPSTICERLEVIIKLLEKQQ